MGRKNYSILTFMKKKYMLLDSSAAYNSMKLSEVFWGFTKWRLTRTRIS